ncbi:AtpZ/AtpI family protein [Desulfovibrio ferrophilus]|uniref:ATP synthase protein I n=1 Tax=Desulfovibrio ferrophilus TaxID=241368 RepID=A0A2Z6B2G0_9BACT|nr:AtpZ/AtpI family protein [Desulfovibrio ferrophilus]BBD09635.1 uncharacterized protein DFE_2909 [Desulfovibrio ferrophilus]
MKNRKPIVDLVVDVGTLGTHMVVCTFVGLAMGYYLDKWLGTKPVMLLIFLFIGIAAGFKNVYEQAQRLQRRTEMPDDKDNSED